MVLLIQCLFQHIIALNIIAGIVAQSMISSTRLFQKYENTVKLAEFSYATIAESRVKCCDICVKTEGCVLANYNKHGHECHLSDVETAQNIESSKTLVDGWNLYFDTADECITSPCMNGATCEDLIGRYSCECVDGWAGDTCNQDIDECSTDPCQNGGTCTNLLNAYNCSCVTGYEGINCETNINDCTVNSCMNGATCVDQVNTYTCTCVSGYSGDIIKFIISLTDNCLINPCWNGGSCTNTGFLSFVCTCIPGYDGDLCETNVDECSPNPCLNGGECSDLVNDYTCNCVTGYDGPNCENNINDCVVHSCMNGATCVDQVNDYTCTCVSGYSGNDCETDIDECSPNPCLNVGTCSDHVNDYTCSCNARYSGTRCETLMSCAMFSDGYDDMQLYNNQCYYVSSNDHPRNTMNDWSINDRNSHLVDINSYAEMQAVKHVFENKHGSNIDNNIWIGGNDIETEGNIVWNDGTPIDSGYTRWKTIGIINDDTKNCVAIVPNANWTWDIFSCMNDYKFVSEEINDN